MLSVKECIKGFDRDRLNNDRLGEIARGTKAFAPNLLEVPSFKMLHETNLVSERTNPSYISWMSNKIKTGLVRSSLPELNGTFIVGTVSDELSQIGFISKTVIYGL